MSDKAVREGIKLTTQGKILKRHSTILFADIFAYSMLMEYSEVETHLLSTKAIETAKDISNKWHGRVTQDSIGDGLIVEFASVEDAMGSALKIQYEFYKYPLALTNGEKILFKIGLNSGEVLVDGEKCIGVVVNNCARIQQHAKPGQILISGSAHNLISDASKHIFEKVILNDLKNIKNLDTIYRCKSEIYDTVPLHVGTKDLSNANRFKPTLAIAPTKSILPDEKIQLVSVVFGELLSSNLAKFKDFSIKPPTTITTHTKDSHALMRMCRLEEVKYLIESTLVPKTGSTNLISCQLVDTLSEKIIWSDSFAISINKLAIHISRFVEISSVRIWASVRTYEEQSISSLPIGQNEYTAFVNARQLIHSIKKSKLKLGITLLRTIVKNRPNFAPAKVELAHAYQLAWRYDWKFQKGNQLDLSVELAEKIIQDDPFNSGAYRELGYSQLFRKESFNAIASMKQAVELNPLDVMAIANLAEGYVFIGEPDRAIKLAKKSLSLNSNVQRDWRLWSLADAYYVARDYKKVLEVVGEMQDQTQGLRLKAASLANLGKLKQAKITARQILKENPDFKVSKWKKKQPDSAESEIDHFCEGLRKAGLPN